jgi:hypothetical protein
MKPLTKKLIIITVPVFAIIIAILIAFFSRPPVLIVTDLAFVPLYGEKRIRHETLISSINLFRPVRVVSIADDAGDEIINIALTEASKSPYCVLFPLRFVRSARLYRERNPQIPVVILKGRYNDNTAFSEINVNESDYYIYTTDIDTEFYRAGVAAAAINMDRNGKIIVFLEPHIEIQARNAFLRAINSTINPLEPVFLTSFPEFIDIFNLSCVVLAGSGAEIFEKDANIPVIFLTWIDPLLLPDDVVLVINDSPWVQAVQAVRMVSGRVNNGKIQSEFRFLKSKNIDRKTLQKMRKQG